MLRATILLAAGLAVTGCQKEQPASNGTPPTSPEPSNTALAANQSQLSETVLHVEGMVCQGCAEAAKTCLTKIDGVVDADVSVDDRSARVRYDASKTSPPDMVAALQAVDRGQAPSFQVTVSGTGE